ncbi:MAG: hypothetical protein ABI867_16470, partial [Kofleriaceae bacterium]
LPAHYVGLASDLIVRRGLYPRGTELLHTVRYVDPDRPSLAAMRIKELRYMVKTEELSQDQIASAYARSEAGSPAPPGDPRVGVTNDRGWRLQGWIEDARGWLRLQTQEEHQYCIGCHSNLGITVDQTFALARKVPGLAGWRLQDPNGIPDAPSVGEDEPEYAAYLERVGAGDELHANSEMLASYFLDGMLLRDRVATTRTDVGRLIAPSRVRAIALDRAYLANVIEQSYVWGREPIVTPIAGVHARIEARSTGLGERDRVYRNTHLQLDWTR